MTGPFTTTPPASLGDAFHPQHEWPGGVRGTHRNSMAADMERVAVSTPLSHAICSLAKQQGGIHAPKLVWT